LSAADLHHLIHTYGYWAVAIIVSLESMGIPLPGETILMGAAIYAGTTHQLDIASVIAAASIGAIVGDNVGFWLGREFGYRLLLRYAGYLRLTEGRIKLGQYMFMRHGGKVVFFGRFVAVLRVLAAFLAGTNRMTWGRFLIFNAAGGIAWATLYGFGAYHLGKQVKRVLGPVGYVGLAAAIIIVVCWFIFLRRNEARLQEEAERALPGPLEPVDLRRRRSGRLTVSDSD
jgi:membrane protein DedA with SNARE-associated domain